MDFVGIDEVLAGDAEAAGGDLFDRRAFAVAVWQRLEAFRIFAAFAGVGFPADAIHRDRERFVGFLRNGAVGHRAGFEALGDHFDRLHFFDRHRLALVFELHQSAQRREVFALTVDLGRVLLEDFIAAGAHRLLQEVNRFRIEEVVLAVLAPLVDAARFERAFFGFDVAVGEGLAVADEAFFGDLLDAGSFAAA